MVRLHWNPRDWSYAEVILIMAVPAILYFVFIMIDLLQTPEFTVLGNVMSEEESWTLKQQYRCHFVIDTQTVGRIEDFDPGRCHHALIPGQKVQLTVRVGRITGQAVVMYGSIKKTD